MDEEERNSNAYMKDLMGRATKPNEKVTVTDINLSMGNVFQIVAQFTIASGILGGLIWWLFFVGRDWWN